MIYNWADDVINSQVDEFSIVNKSRLSSEINSIPDLLTQLTDKYELKINVKNGV